MNQSIFQNKRLIGIRIGNALRALAPCRAVIAPKEISAGRRLEGSSEAKSVFSNDFERSFRVNATISIRRALSFVVHAKQIRIRGEQISRQQLPHCVKLVLDLQTESLASLHKLLPWWRRN